MKNNTKKLVGVLGFIILVGAVICFYLFKDKRNVTNQNEVDTNVKELLSEYRLSGNSLENFDLYFLQLENTHDNKVYSPLSIKYALAMLSDGANGTTKKQIDAVIGDYSSKKYTNSKYMSLANAMFIKDSYKNNVSKDYIDTLNNKYNAEVIYDSFASANGLNKWVSGKTFNLIDNLYDDVSAFDYILVNALAIDMEWVNKIQSETKDFSIEYSHEDYRKYISPLTVSYYRELEFDKKYNSKSVEIGAVANKYDIINDLGEDAIRNKITEEYKKFVADGGCGDDPNRLIPESELKEVNDSFVKELKENYKQIEGSTDFYFYDDDQVKVFAKDLKTYDNTTLEYVGIMPKTSELVDYIKNTDATKINGIINNLKPIELNSFEEGYITEIKGYIPMFKFEYELKLMNDLNKLGIIDVFDSNKADISKLTSDKGAYISSATHKANIEFSNEGIKAAAATTLGGMGDASCEFDYKFSVPVKTIDLTFNKPYMFIIRDKSSSEVWFAGTVYQPMQYVEYYEPSNN